METSVEKLVALSFLVTGLSHILQPRAWAEFFVLLREKGEVGSLLNGLLHFPMGALIVSFHNVWHGWPLVVTLMGWSLVMRWSATTGSSSRPASPRAKARSPRPAACSASPATACMPS